MEKLCRFFIYFILFIVLYQYFYKVVEGHNIQSSSNCSESQNRTDCRSKAPSCYWGGSDGKRSSGSGSCLSSGSTTSASKFHVGNHHARDHNHPIDPSLGQDSGRVEDSGENQSSSTIGAMCDTYTCPDNYVKRDTVDNIFQGEDARQTCCRPHTCDTFECGENSEPVENSSSINQFDPPEAPTELPQARCCTSVPPVNCVGRWNTMHAPDAAHRNYNGCGTSCTPKRYTITTPASGTGAPCEAAQGAELPCPCLNASARSARTSHAASNLAWRRSIMTPSSSGPRTDPGNEGRPRQCCRPGRTGCQTGSSKSWCDTYGTRDDYCTGGMNKWLMLAEVRGGRWVDHSWVLPEQRSFAPRRTVGCLSWQ
jgi:hypothetical protein